MPWLVLPVIWSKTLYLLFVPSGLFVIDIQGLKDMYNKQGITAYMRLISSQEVTHAPTFATPNVVRYHLAVYVEVQAHLRLPR